MSIPGPNLRGAVDLSALVNRTTASASTTGAVDGASPVSGGGQIPPQEVQFPLVSTVGEADFERVIELSMSVPVIVSLEAEWAEQAIQQAKALERTVKKQAGALVLVRVDAEKNPQLAQALQLRAVPTVVAIIAGRPLALFEGVVPEEQLDDVASQVRQLAERSGVTGHVVVSSQDSAEPVEEVIEAPMPALHQEAYDAIQRDDLDAAIKAYHTALAQNPADDEAKAGLAQVSLLSRLKGVNSEELRSTAANNPDDAQAQLAVADLDLGGGHIEDAFDRLLSLFPRLDHEAREAVRERLLDYFEIIGVTDPRVTKARGRLASLLY